MYNEKLISNDILDEKTYHYVLKDGLNVYKWAIWYKIWINK